MRQSFHLIVLLIVCLVTQCKGYACVSDVSMSIVISAPSEFDSEIQEYRGFISVEDHIPRLYATYYAARRVEHAKVIDLAPDDREIDRKMQSFRKITCVVLLGKFREYDKRKRFIGFGNFISSIGVIEVQQIKSCR